MIVGITAHEIIVNECIAENIDFEELYLGSRDLLVKLNDGKAFAKRRGRNWIKNTSKKIPYRTLYLKMAEEPWKYSRKEKRSFAWKVVCEQWFEEKSHLMLEQMKKFVEEGAELAHIIEAVYMRGTNTQKTDLSMQLELNMGHTKYFSVKKDAIVLYGLMLWKYCKRRDYEDKDRGIIDYNGYFVE